MIVVDSKATIAGSTGTTNTSSFTNAVGNILFVGVISVGNVITSVTYNGVTMTIIGSAVQIPTNTGYISFYYLVSPATGANNIVINTSSSVYTGGVAVSYSRAKGVLDGNNNNTVTTGTSVSTSITTTDATDWMVGICGTDANAVSAGAGTTLRQVGDNTLRGMFDSNGPLAIGSNALNVNFGSSNAAFIVAAFKGSKTTGFIIGEI